jgi:hypothetical protein
MNEGQELSEIINRAIDDIPFRWHSQAWGNGSASSFLGRAPSAAREPFGQILGVFSMLLVVQEVYLR